MRRLFVILLSAREAIFSLVVLLRIFQVLAERFLYNDKNDV